MNRFIAIFLIIIFQMSSSLINAQTKKNLTGNEISDNFVKALGGKKKLLKVKTMTMIAVAKIQGTELQIESYRKAPNKMLVKMKSPQGTMTRILNGDKAFAITPNGNQPIIGVDLDALKEEATIYPELYIEKFGYKLDYLGIESLNNREMYKVKVILPNGNFRTNFYDKETGLLYKMIDEIESESYYEDYREIKGVKIPHTIKLVSNQGTLTFKIKEIFINPEFEDKIFEIE